MSADSLSTTFCSISIDRLPRGATLGSTIYDSDRTKLLTAGTGITEQLIDSLHRRKVESVVVSQRDMGRIVAFQPQGKARSAVAARESVTIDFENDVSKELDRDVERTGGGTLAPSENAFAKRLNPTSQASYDQEFTNYLAEKREHHVDRLSSLNEACIRGDTSALSCIATIVGETLDAAIEDIDAFTCLGANPYSLPYPARHSLHSAMLATSVGAKLGLDEVSLHELGMGCMIHDIGMLAIDRMTVGARKVLDAGEFVEIAKHPFVTFDILEANLDAIPSAARMVAYQMHERCDGSGYPRGRTLEQTHPLARVASAIDAYTALVAPRPHRPGMLPYYAMEKMVKDVGQGIYDPQVVRGLLRTIGLFPLGSYVELSDGSVGRVIRANENYTRPVVERWQAGNLSAPPVIIDLMFEPQLSVKRPVADPKTVPPPAVKR
jgi:HD-GYP domain-containing protein (c-di-GMP phosphodiesterase class II)